MFEVKLTITAPGLETALTNLSAAIAGRQTATPATHDPASTAPVNPIPVAQTTGSIAYPSNQQAPTPPAPATYPSPAPQLAAPVGYPAPGVPVSQPQQYTVEQIMAAGATLMDAGKITELMNLLSSFGVQAVTDLKTEQLGAFATALRSLGAKI